MAPTIVDHQDKLRSLLVHISERMSETCFMFVDLEGVNLGRQGTIAIMQLLIPPEPVVYLVDVHLLGSRAFEFTIDGGTSLKSILESRSIPKVFFDVRNDSDALYAHFGINVFGVIDLQVLEFATRQAPRGRFVHGLARCITRDLSQTTTWSMVKDNGQRLFLPERGGSYEVFLQRPMMSDIVKYCENDVMLMPQLLSYYGSRLRHEMAGQIQGIVDDRIRLSKTTTFNGKGRHMAVGPHLSLARSPTNTQISPEMDLVCSARLSELCGLDADVPEDLINRFDAMTAAQEQSAVSSRMSPSLNSTDDDALESDLSVGTASMLATDLALFEQLTAGNEEELSESTDDEELARNLDYGDVGYDSGSDRDFTACSADDCGYCGRCGY